MNDNIIWKKKLKQLPEKTQVLIFRKFEEHRKLCEKLGIVPASAAKYITDLIETPHLLMQD